MVFVEVMGEKRASKLLQRIEFHYTPKHGSWLNMAEIEIGMQGEAVYRSQNSYAREVNC